MIPKAIEYSAGILEYFFRGKIAVSSPVAQNDRLEIQITNLSGQELKDGIFALYVEDHNGNRTRVTDFNYDDYINDPNHSLADNGILNADFLPDPVEDKYILIFKGTIGADAGGNALDPVDDGLAIAVKRFNATASPPPPPPPSPYNVSANL